MRRAALPTSLGLLATSLVLLYVGDFLSLDDTSPFTSHDASTSLGYLAAAAAAASVVVSLFDRVARQALGGALLLLDAVIFFWSGADEGFRFVWTDDDGEFLILQLTLVLLGLALMTPSFRAPVDDTVDGDAGRRRAVTGWARTVIYLSLLVVVPFVALFLGVAHFESTECGGAGGDCDLGFLEGLVWATIAVVVVVVGIVGTEVTVRVRRARARARSRSGEAATSG